MSHVTYMNESCLYRYMYEESAQVAQDTYRAVSTIKCVSTEQCRTREYTKELPHYGVSHMTLYEGAL